MTAIYRDPDEARPIIGIQPRDDSMAGVIDVNKLASMLWQDDAETVYVILDGAGIPDLLDKLYATPALEFSCLYRGTLGPDVAEVAPYLVKLERNSEFFEWVASGWGKSWGIFVVAPAALDLAAVRRHFRKMNFVIGPDGGTLLFRYYDPRALQAFLPTCDAAQGKEFFGPVRALLAEIEGTPRVTKFMRAQDGSAAAQSFDLTSA